MSRKKGTYDLLEEEIRKYKSLVRQLRRQVKELKKLQVPCAEEEPIPIKKGRKKKCPECRENVETISVNSRTFDRCTYCGWRSKTKKG